MAPRPAHRSVLDAASDAEDVSRSGGGKARNLHRLTAAGVRVPTWSVISAETFKWFCQSNDLAPQLEAALTRVHDGNVEEIAAEIAAILSAGDLDDSISGAIEAAYRHVGVAEVAIRSSSADEDAKDASFAGQYETFLNVVAVSEVVRCVRLCWASAYSARSLRYRLLRGLGVEAVDMAVIVQAMAPADKSGVLFTVNPVSRRADELFIAAAFGLGEGVVDGAVDADSIVLDRATGAVKNVTVGNKERRIESLEAGGVAYSPVNPDLRGRLALSNSEMAGLFALARQVERIFGCPQDIEWAIAGGELWVLQSRPVTTAVDAPPGEPRLWDNSNIIESFDDVTAPLTYSFARLGYEQVFRDHCRLIGLPSRDRAEVESWLPNLLGYFEGRVYYNLLNWYKLIGLLPLYGPHRRIFEMSLGVSESLDAGRAAELRPLKRSSRLAELAVRARVAVRFVWAFATIEVSVRRFLRHCYRLYDEFDPIDYSSLSAEEIYRIYTDAERRLLSRWGRMILLEAVLALSFGAMYALTARWMPDAPDALVWEMAKVEDDLESAQPVERLKALARLLDDDPSLAAIVDALPAGREYETLVNTDGDGAAAFRARIDEYLADFGYRNANELKLEEPDLRDSPTALFEMIGQTRAQLGVEAARASGGGERYLREHLRGPRLWIYQLVRRRVQRALRARESVRFCRTRTFGIARRMFRAIGEDMARFGALERASDIFYLRIEELRGAFGGTIAHRELKPVVELRKQLECEYRDLRAPGRFETSGTVYWGGLQRAWSAPAGGEGWDGQTLAGVPCSPGIAEGEARVVTEPRDVGSNIVVAYRTDPGWLPVLAFASGLVIERGSPLTHVAVVARELGVPTVIQVPRVTERVHTGQRIRVDGTAGTVTIQGHLDGEQPVADQGL